MGAGFQGKFKNTRGAKEAANTRQSLPQNNAQLKHIFSGKDGHLTDTPQNRQLLSDLANDTSKLAGKDKYGNSWNIETTKEGFQNWVRYQNGTINEGGRNLVPRICNNSTSLNNNPIKRRKMPK